MKYYLPVFVSIYYSLLSGCDEVQDVCLLNKSLSDFFNKHLPCLFFLVERRGVKVLATRTFIDVINDGKR